MKTSQFIALLVVMGLFGAGHWGTLPADESGNEPGNPSGTVAAAAATDAATAEKPDDDADKSATLRLGVFNVNATPPLGSPVAYAPARKIEDPLSARGIVLLGNDEPIVLCAVDWIGIGNGGSDVWREKLAQAAGTTPQYVSVHSLHQHDGPRCDFTAEQFLDQQGLGGRFQDTTFSRSVIEKVAAAVREAIKNAKPVTELGFGQARVQKVASNRRVLGPDGKVKFVRYSSCRNPEAIAAPEGVIDPLLRCVSFWNGDQTLAVLTYYATHPQSYYGKGDVTAEFVGIARAQREAALPGVPHIHFNGASGNVAAGKYNDGSPKMRPILAQRMADGMQAAWEATVRTPIHADDIAWKTRAVTLPAAGHLHVDELKATLQNEKASAKERASAASNLAWLQRVNAGHQIDLSCLRLGRVYLVQMPGELFVEYQLAAQQLRPDDHVCMAAYGDYGPGYIGTEIAYSQGGYETSQRASRVAPPVEHVLMTALGELLK